MKSGKNFTLGEYVIIKKPDLVEVGDNVRISDFCRISSGCEITHSVPNVKEIQGNVTMEKYTGIGTNSVIMPDNHIPEGVSIGALSFVPSNFKFEPWTVYAGRPIRAIKKRNRENVLNTLRKLGRAV